MSAPRVLVSGVVLDQPMGGVRRHNMELLPRVAERLARDGGGLALLESRSGVAFDLPPTIERIASSVPSRPILVRAVRETRALARAIEEAQREGRPFHLVHTAHLPAPRHLPLPYTLTVHDLRSLDLPHTPFSRRLIAKRVIGRALEEARAVFAVSEHTAERLRAGWPSVEGKLSIVPNAADHFEPLPRAPGAEAGLLHLGHLEPRKNLELLVRALAAEPRLPDLCLAGASHGAEDERLRRLARELDVEERVHFPGPFGEGELPELLAGCACVVLPSRLEGFGIVALEAQLARAPLAVSTAGALTEVAGDDVPTFDPDDPVGCARSVLHAIDESRAMLDARAERAARFRWDTSAAAWVEGMSRAASGGER